MGRKGLFLARVATFMGLLAVVPPAAADERLSNDKSVGSLTGFGDTVAWMDVRDDDREARRADVVIASGTKVTRTGLRIYRHAPLDVGPRSGRAQIVYSRCVENDDCELFRYDSKTRREYKLRRASSRNCRETAPALWRGSVVFYRSQLEYRGAPKCRTGIYRQSGTGHPELVRRVDPSGDQGSRNYVAEIDVRGKAIAFLLRRDEGRQQEVWVRPANDAEFEQVASGSTYYTGCICGVSEVQVVGARVYWMQDDGQGEDYGERRIVRRAIAGGPTEYSTDRFAFTSAAFSTTHLVYGDATGVSRTQMPTDWQTAP